MTIAADDVDLERDSMLVQQCKAGRAEAFDELYRLYHDRIVRHCARRLSSHANAEDVAQEAFLRAWRAIDRFEGRQRFYPWLHVIASNACTDVLRRQRPTTSLSELAGAAELDDAQGVEELYATSIDASVAGEAMRMLNERHRRVLHLREELEWSVQDIAAHEGLEPNAIDSLLWRARAALRTKFQRLSEGVAAAFAGGSTGFFSLRHRCTRVVHAVHVPGRMPLSARAAVAVAVVVGAGATSVPLLAGPSAHPRSGVTTQSVTSVGTSGRSAGITTARRGSSIAPSTGTPATSGTAVGSVVTTQGGTSIASSRRASTHGAEAVPAPATAAASSPLSSSTGTPAAGAPVVGPSTSEVVAAAGDTTQAVVGVVSGVTGAVTATAGGAVQATVGGPAPILSPVRAPVLQPITGGTTGSGTGITLP